MERKSGNSTQILFIFLALVTVSLLYLLEPILMPFLAGALLAYLCNPLVNKLQTLRIPRLFAVIIVFSFLFLGIILLVLLFIPLIQRQIASLSAVLNNIFMWVQQNLMPWLIEHLGIQQENLQEQITQNLVKTGSLIGAFLKTALHSGKAFFEGLMNIILIPVVTFYLLRDWNIVIDNIRLIIPRKIRPTVIRLAKQCDSVLSAFFRGQLLVMVVLGIMYSVGLTLVGLQVGVVIGLTAGLVSIVPYLGFIIGLTLAVIAALVQYGTLNAVSWVIAVFLIGQLIESTILTPKLVGNRIGIHPVAVIFAILAGGTLFGFFGVLLALPVAAVIMVLLKNLYHYHEAVFKKT